MEQRYSYDSRYRPSDRPTVSRQALQTKNLQIKLFMTHYRSTDTTVTADPTGRQGTTITINTTVTTAATVTTDRARVKL